MRIGGLRYSVKLYGNRLQEFLQVFPPKMIDLLSKKARGGDLYINIARQYLDGHEWGRARMALEKGIAKGRLSEPDKASALLQDTYIRLGIIAKVSG